MAIGQDLLNAPFPQIVKQLGVGIAEAQYELDQVSLRLLQLLAGYRQDENTGQLVPDDSSLVRLSLESEPVSLLALGFTPTFYQFVDTVIELKMAMSMSVSREVSAEVSAKARSFFYAASVNAKYSQKYQYSAEGSSLMRTKLVTVPAPAALEDRIRRELVDTEEEPETGD